MEISATIIQIFFVAVLSVCYSRFSPNLAKLCLMTLLIGVFGLITGPYIFALDFAKQVWLLFDSFIALLSACATYWVIKKGAELSKFELTVCYVLLISFSATIFVDMLIHYEYVIKDNDGVKNFFIVFSKSMNVMQLCLLSSPLGYKLMSVLRKWQWN